MDRRERERGGESESESESLREREREYSHGFLRVYFALTLDPFQRVSIVYSLLHFPAQLPAQTICNKKIRFATELILSYLIFLRAVSTRSDSQPSFIEPFLPGHPMS